MFAACFERERERESEREIYLLDKEKKGKRFEKCVCERERGTQREKQIETDLFIIQKGGIGERKFIS